MVKMEFSEEEVKFAHAADLLGLHVIERVPVGPNETMSKLVVLNTNQSYEISNKKIFNQLKVGDKVNLIYIIHHKEFNEKYL